MTPERYEQIAEIFAKVREATPDNRPDLLRRLCGDDDELRRQVETFLEAEEADVPSPLGAPVIQNAALLASAFGARVEELSTGTAIGPYRIDRRIGEGGFGIVYLAEQLRPIRRQVALKVIKPGMDSASVIGRFEHERQTLAILDHPNIARVIDAGTTPNGYPYFVMEYVDGEPITKFCDHHRLTLRQRLELFIPVCEAVQHAHMKGIIHRDITPNNILVSMRDGQPVPKVIDFGIAKAITPGEQAAFTISGQLIGTPEYMSPEQAMRAEDIDTRTDVYSLGVVLYELLSGSPPFDSAMLRGAGEEAIRRIIAEEEPPKPSTKLITIDESASAEIAKARQTDRQRIARELQRELEWIPLKALRKERGRRYVSAESFASDLRRYIDGEALEAAPESTAYRLKKALCRYRGPAIAVSLVVLSLAAGVGIAAWQRSQAVAAQRLAQARFSLVREIANKFLNQFDETLSRLPGALEAREQLVATSLDYLRRLAAGDEVEASLAMEISEAYLRVAEIQGGRSENNLGRLDDAISSIRRAVAISEKTYRSARNDTQVALTFARSKHCLGMQLAMTSSHQESQSALEEALSLRQEVLHRLPASAEAAKALFESLSGMGDVAFRAGQIDDARSDLAAAIELLNQNRQRGVLWSGSDRDQVIVHLLASAIELDDGQLDAALTMLDRAERAISQLANREPPDLDTDRLLGVVLERRASAAALAHDYANAERYVMDRVRLVTGMVSRSPGDAQLERDLGIALRDAGDCAADAGDSSAAMLHYAESMKLFRRLNERNPNDREARAESLGLCHRLATQLLHLDRAGDAREHLLAGEELARRVDCTSDDLENARAKCNVLGLLSSAESAVGNSKDAIRWAKESFEQRMRMMTRWPAESTVRVSIAIGAKTYGDILLDNGRVEEAVEVFGKTIERLMSETIGQGEMTFACIQDFAAAIRSYRPDVARRWYHQMLVIPEIRDRIPATQNWRANRAISEFRNGSPDQALAALDDVIEASRSNGDAADAELMAYRSMALFALRRFDEAAAALESARAADPTVAADPRSASAEASEVLRSRREDQ